MRFLGNRPPPLYHDEIAAALDGLSEVDDTFAVAGVEPRFVREWLARCWAWRRVGERRIFSRA